MFKLYYNIRGVPDHFSSFYVAVHRILRDVLEVSINDVIKVWFKVKADANEVKRVVESVKNPESAKFFVFSGKRLKLNFFKYLTWFRLKAENVIFCFFRIWFQPKPIAMTRSEMILI